MTSTNGNTPNDIDVMAFAMRYPTPFTWHVPTDATPSPVAVTTTEPAAVTAAVDWKAEFNAMGGNSTHARVQSGVRQRREQAEKDYAAAQPKLQRLAQTVTESIRLGMQITAFVVMTIAVLGGLVLAIGLIGYAEWQSVKAGIALVEPHFASLYAMALVVIMWPLRFIGLMLHDEETGANATPRYRFSLRLLGDGMLYTLGVGQVDWSQWFPNSRLARSLSLQRGKWQPLLQVAKPLSIQNAINLTVIAVIVFGTMGRLGVELVKPMYQEVAWFRAIWLLLTSSNLPTLLSIIGMLVLTLAIVSAQHFLIEFIYRVVKASGGGSILNFSSSAATLTREQYAAEAEQEYYKELVQLMRHKQLANNSG